MILSGRIAAGLILGAAERIDFRLAIDVPKCCYRCGVRDAGSVPAEHGGQVFAFGAKVRSNSDALFASEYDLMG